MKARIRVLPVIIFDITVNHVCANLQSPIIAHLHKYSIKSSLKVFLRTIIAHIRVLPVFILPLNHKNVLSIAKICRKYDNNEILHA